MKIVKIYLEGISPYSQSRMHRTPMKDRESHDDYERRTWKQKCTINKEGQVVVPAMAIKQCLDTSAQKLGMKVPGRRGSTFKGFFASGVLVQNDVPIANGKKLTPDDANEVTISANADGRRGSGKRVPRTFPEFPKWHGVAEVLIVDDIITVAILEEHAKAAGMIVGLGRFRAENGGLNGRFKVIKVEAEDFSL